jgi:hypothetical protein
VDLANRVLRRFLFGAEEKPEEGKKKPKRLVMMVGPPAAGKGFFVGDPGPEGSFGWKFPESTHGLFKKEDVPDTTEYDESDNHLRFVQQAWARENFDALKEAHAKGKEAFDDVLKGMWYDTKDGKKVSLGDATGMSFDSFSDDFDKFFGKANKDFYVSMRGWHDDASKTNPETGKAKERFKDEARHRFDDAVSEKIDSTDKDMFIVDSAGEDIDAQDFKAQIERAKAAGYDVTVVFLHPEKADTELSNLARGKVQGKRMVDQADIDNWYEKNEQALKDIQAASPDNFLHYRKPPPDPDPAKAAEMRRKAREAMEKLPAPPVKEKGESAEAFKERQSKWKKDNKEALDLVTHTLYKAAPYPDDPEKTTSWGRSLDHERVPAKPPEDLAGAVAKMNDDAAKRYEEHLTEDERKKHEEKKEEREKKKPSKEEGGVSRMDFLHEEGDRKVPNPNPKSKTRWPEVQIRSLDWEYQKPYYEKWVEQRKKKKEAAVRVARRFMERVIMAEEKDENEFLKKAVKKIHDIAADVEKGIKDESQYPVSTKTLNGPTFFLVFKGGQGDVTEGKKLKPKIEKLVGEAIKKHIELSGMKNRVLFSNKGEDLLCEVDVLFP